MDHQAPGKNVVELLRLIRHDWLNHIQVIKGYISMGRFDRVEEMLNQIVSDLEQESRLSNLNVPRLAELFLTYNWTRPKVPLKYQVEKTGIFKDNMDGSLTVWFENFFRLLDKAVSDDWEQTLKVVITNKKDLPYFYVDFFGELDDGEELFKFLQEAHEEWKIFHLKKDRGSLSFSIQFHPVKND